ncbi:MAG: 4Fe-4S dicluster domain-containing protein, partial [Pelagibacterales bacterium]|nr:4Fe-4S dicluster domain-containing protein [Pelagibacterales bacterium]
GPNTEDVLMIPAAIEAGLGQLGKHGSLINRTFGSNFRLSMVLTDLPLEPDTPDEFGSEEFCESCQVCANACPPDAIFREKQLIRGDKKWYVDFDKCIPYFGEHLACGICIAVCPYTRPGVAPRLIEKSARRQAGRSEPSETEVL